MRPSSSARAERAARAEAIRRYTREFSRQRAAVGKPPAPRAMKWAAVLMVDYGTTQIDVVYAEYRKDECLARAQPDLRGNGNTERADDACCLPEREPAANDDDDGELDQSPPRDVRTDEAAVQAEEADVERGRRRQIVARLVSATLRPLEAGDMERAVGMRSAILRGQPDFAHEYMQAVPIEANEALDEYEIIVAECAERASKRESDRAWKRATAREARKNAKQRTRRAA